MPCSPAHLLALFLAGLLPAGGAVVMDQIGDASGYDLDVAGTPNASQVFSDFAPFDSIALDDFVVGADSLRLSEVSGLFRAAGGFDRFGDITAWQVSIFSDPALGAATISGDVASLSILPGSAVTLVQAQAGNDAVVSLAVDLTLPSPGTYWLGIAPVSALGVSGQFFLHNDGAAAAGSPGNGNGYFANPAEAFGVGDLSATSYDFAYRVGAIPEPGSTTLALVTTGTLLLRRRRKHAISADCRVETGPLPGSHP